MTHLFTTILTLQMLCPSEASIPPPNFLKFAPRKRMLDVVVIQLIFWLKLQDQVRKPGGKLLEDSSFKSTTVKTPHLRKRGKTTN